jgi:ATP-dependent DNA helicase RecQ
MRDKPLSEREVTTQLINESVAYAESGVCRRKVLMSYFGEEYGNENCGHCDNCKHPKERMEVKAETVQLLKAIQALDERFATEYIIKVVTGHLTPQIKMYRHEGLEVFGSGKSQPEHFWNSLIRQMILENLLQKDIEEYGVIKIMKKGLDFIKKPKPFTIVMNNLYENAFADDEEGSVEEEAGAPIDETLFNLLKDIRFNEAKKKNLPPFVLFLESSLQDMATFYPTTTTELEKCQGVSKGKAIRYGKPFIDAIANYVEEKRKRDKQFLRIWVQKKRIKT